MKANSVYCLQIAIQWTALHFFNVYILLWGPFQTLLQNSSRMTKTRLPPPPNARTTTIPQSNETLRLPLPRLGRYDMVFVHARHRRDHKKPRVRFHHNFDHPWFSLPPSRVPPNLHTLGTGRNKNRQRDERGRFTCCLLWGSALLSPSHYAADSPGSCCHRVEFLRFRHWKDLLLLHRRCWLGCASAGPDEVLWKRENVAAVIRYSR